MKLTGAANLQYSMIYSVRVNPNEGYICPIFCPVQSYHNFEITWMLQPPNVFFSKFHMKSSPTFFLSLCSVISKAHQMTLPVTLGVSLIVQLIQQTSSFGWKHNRTSTLCSGLSLFQKNRECFCFF